MEKVQWNSIDKKQNGLEQSKNDTSSTIPRYYGLWTVLIVISIFFLAGSGWIVGAGFGKLCNLSTASGEGTPKLYIAQISGQLYFLLFLKV